MTAIDAETGLPKIPEGYFWRVVRAAGWHPVEVQLRYQDELVRYKATFGTEEHVRSTALHIWQDFAEGGRSGVIDRLVGDYPPKKLEDVK